MVAGLAVVLFITLAGGELAEGLKCQVGMSMMTKEMECTGNWTDVETKLMTEFGNRWTEVKSGFEVSLSNISDWFNTNINHFADFVSGRKRREADIEIEVGSDYYCVKRVYAGQVFKSCLSKESLGVRNMTCLMETEGEVCTCNDRDNCNSGEKMVFRLISLILPTILIHQNLLFT